MEPLRLGFTTYSMPELDVFEVVPWLAEVGYEAVELTVSEGYTASPDRLDGDDRERLRELIADVGFPSPAVMDLVAPCATGTARTEMLERVRETCRLARDLNLGERPTVVKTPITGEQPDWDGNEERIRHDLEEVADIAAEHDVVFAPEAHVNTALDSIEKTRWLFDHTDHPALGLNFDVSHFPEERFDVERAVEVCAPHAVTTHVKDVEVVDGEVWFHLPGSTDFEYGPFFDRLVAAGYRGDVIAEISAQLWREPGFDPWESARTCYENLVGPLEAANGRHASTGEGNDDLTDHSGE